METQPRALTTPDLASQVGITPESLRVHLCRRGSYFGLVPDRLPNGRLLWPADSLERLKEEGRKTSIRMPTRQIPTASGSSEGGNTP